MAASALSSGLFNTRSLLSTRSSGGSVYPRNKNFKFSPTLVGRGTKPIPGTLLITEQSHGTVLVLHVTGTKNAVAPLGLVFVSLLGSVGLLFLCQSTSYVLQANDLVHQSRISRPVYTLSVRDVVFLEFYANCTKSGKA